uniref:Uncharacterized protein n=1 Tax=Rhizophora mucronata TaxID=61149 RepID=A0A2P2QQ54_RHIMU
MLFHESHDKEFMAPLTAEAVQYITYLMT